ncbi:hypothetical protein BZA77DRAFT_309698 [Pyronema omphalodes]|nr:hypothetical protein BZA77DRAFT_309698 [Pyronema omphalodes]
MLGFVLLWLDFLWCGFYWSLACSVRSKSFGFHWFAVCYGSETHANAILWVGTAFVRRMIMIEEY